MITIKPTYENDIINGAWLSDNEATIYVPFSLCIVIADAITFVDKDIIGTRMWAGYIEIYFDYDGTIELFDGEDIVVVERKEIKEFSEQLWDLV